MFSFYFSFILLVLLFPLAPPVSLNTVWTNQSLFICTAILAEPMTVCIRLGQEFELPKRCLWQRAGSRLWELCVRTYIHTHTDRHTLKHEMQDTLGLWPNKLANFIWGRVAERMGEKKTGYPTVEDVRYICPYLEKEMDSEVVYYSHLVRTSKCIHLFNQCALK